jgi:hypothetical protein
MNEALRRVVAILTELGLPFFAAGSVASSIHGLPRFTRDVDLVVAITPDAVYRLASRAAGEFYIDPEYAASAISSGRSFNLIHLATASKIDIFPLEHTEFQASELARSTAASWAVPGHEPIELRVASPEDTVLFKLCWYEKGGRVSDHQWTDNSRRQRASRPAVLRGRSAWFVNLPSVVNQ